MSLVFGNLEAHPVPAVAEDSSDVPDGLGALWLGVVACIYRLAHELHLAFVLGDRQRGFPQCPRPSSVEAQHVRRTRHKTPKGSVREAWLKTDADTAPEFMK